MPNRALLPALCLVFFLAFVPAAKGQPAPPASRPASGPADKPDRLFSSEHQIAIGSRVLKYRATAAALPMRDEAGKLKASIFFVAYELDRGPDADPATRPITFVFNGGPGAAAVWLHIGAVGPKRISLANEEGEAPAPPYKLVDNTSTWLDLTDLVFIDPVNTGYSRPAAGEAKEQFHGVEEDVTWVAAFIRLYTTRYERWASPKFLAGESYGTTRAAALSEYLLDHDGIALNGIVFLSSVLDFRTLASGKGNDLPYQLYLPSFAAVAWYHKKLPADLQADLAKTLKEVERYAANDYLVALNKGGGLTAEERKAVAAKLSRYTTLPADFIEQSDLRISPEDFQKRLLGDRRRIGRFDGRIAGIDPNPTNKYPGYDPSLSRYLPLYSGAFNDYVRRTLKYESDLPYEVLTGKVQPWNFGAAGEGYLNVSGQLHSAMVKNPHMKVLFGSGYFDLATPYLSADYTINHLDLAHDLAGNITRTYYMGGHMMYHQKASLEKLKTDVAAFITSAVP